ncbi:MAG TPA: zinc-dependent alcohol dehydrogenase family protein [Solirubrobacteraceae bacterium]
MILAEPGRPLQLVERAVPEPGPGELLLRVRACGVCRTDVHVRDGEVRGQRLPIVPGHQIVGSVEGAGSGTTTPAGARVGVPWLGWTCGECRFCRSDRENLCLRARFTGLDIDGGFAEWTVADERFCFPLPDGYDDLDVAPLLCAGLIGHRALRMTGEAQRLGLYGFGAAAHIVAQTARHEGRRVFAFTHADDGAAQRFALELGCEWAGDALAPGPKPLDAAIIFAPVGELVPAALRALDRGGMVVCAGIHMSEIPAFPYDILWEERSVRSVANLTRADGHDFLALAPQVPIRTRVTTFALEQAEDALDAIRAGGLEGAAVLVP